MNNNEKSSAFDQVCSLPELEAGFSQTNIPNCNGFSMEDHHSNQIPQQEVAASALDMDFQHQLHLEMESCYNNGGGGDIQEIVTDSNWQEMANFHNTSSYSTTPDFLINMFPRCSSSSLIPNSSNTASKSPNFLASLGLLGELINPGDGPSSSASVVYDPLLPLSLPPQPPLLRELFHSLPHGGYARNNGSLFDERDHQGSDDLYQNGDGRGFENGVFEFTAGEMECLGKNRDGKATKHYSTERHRRVLLNDKYQDLRKLVPNPTKNDRASIVGDAIDYINELKRTVTELKVLVERKRCTKERLKRLKTEDEAMEESKSSEMEQPHNNGSSSLRSSWLHRKSKHSEVDVRIIDDEVTVKLVQQKRINCLLFVSKVLDDFHLDLHHVAGGLIGDYYSFLFNSKIGEGSIVYASAVANKLIEVVDKQYAAIIPTSSY